MYCSAMKMALDELGVSYKEETVKNTSVPKLFYNDELLFDGLPDYTEIITWVKETYES